MKALLPVILLPVLGFASGNNMILLACLVVAIVIAVAAFCYLLITRPEVTPRYKRGDDGVEFRFERLPKRPGNDDQDSEVEGQRKDRGVDQA